MAARTQELARLLVEEYDGDAAALWATAPSGAELLKRVPVADITDDESLGKVRSYKQALKAAAKAKAGK
jgi:hypothetical protein